MLHINDGMMHSKHSITLTRDAVHHNQSSICDTQSGRDLRGEVHVAGRVDQVDEETQPILALLDEGHVILVQLVVQGDGAVEEAQQKRTQQHALRTSALDTRLCFSFCSSEHVTDNWFGLC